MTKTDVNVRVGEQRSGAVYASHAVNCAHCPHSCGPAVVCSGPAHRSLGEGGQITGTIVEARTGAPLPAVLVKVQSTGQQAFSDADGRFEIADVPIGSQTLLVSVVGYGLVRRDVTVSGTDTVDVTIPVNEGASTYVEEVSVGGSRFREAEPGVASQSVLGSREILALRGLVADDPFRAVQVLPGVTTGDDFRAEFAVRGLGPQNIGISIDGVDSPLLFHTVRGVQDTGSLALINSDILESASLLAGPHPQRLNSHLGSRLDFTTRDGSRERLTVRGMVSASAASTVLEGPIGGNKNASWMVSLRKSYIDWLLRQIDSTTDTTFGFTDGQAKVTIDLTPRQTLRASVIAGRSVLRENEDPPDANTLDPATNTSVIGNLQWRFTPSATFTTSQQLYYIDSKYQNRVYDGRTREEGYDRDLTWRGTGGWNPKSGHLIEFGAQAQSLSAKRIDRRFQINSEQLLLDTTIDAWSTGGWAHYRWTPNPRWSITPGVRVDHWQLYDQTRASPWLLAEYEVRPDTRAAFRRRHPAPVGDDRSLDLRAARSASCAGAGRDDRSEHRTALRIGVAHDAVRLPSPGRRSAAPREWRCSARRQSRGAALESALGKRADRQHQRRRDCRRAPRRERTQWLVLVFLERLDGDRRCPRRDLRRRISISGTPSTRMSPIDGAAAPASRRGCATARTFRSSATSARIPPATC